MEAAHWSPLVPIGPEATYHLFGNQYGYLRPPKQFLEIGIKCDKVFTQLNNHCRKPRIRNIVGSQLLVYAKLPQ